MTHSPYIFDATAENFTSLVLTNSDKGPVLVNYWSPRAGPCMMLMPQLIRLATEFGGRFLLVMVNTDDLGPLAHAHGVASLPTVKMFRNGAVVDTLHGAQPEPSLRDFVNKHVNRDADTLHVQSLQSYQSGDIEHAVKLAGEAALAAPDDVHIPLDVAKLLVLQGRLTRAEELLKSLPANSGAHPEVRDLLAHIRFIAVGRAAAPRDVLEQAIAADANDLEARYQLGALNVVQDNYEGAMAQLLEIARRNPSFREHAAQDGLSALFHMLGDEDARVRRYRNLLTGGMH